MHLQAFRDEQVLQGSRPIDRKISTGRQGDPQSQGRIAEAASPFRLMEGEVFSDQKILEEEAEERLRG